MRLFFSFCISLLLLFGALDANDFAEVKRIELKKDEIKEITVKYEHYEKPFKFRWTLYKNEGLVMFYSYGTKVMQNILYLNTKNQSFKVYLKTKGADFYEVPYFLVKFKEFNFKKHQAVFELFLSDKRSQIKLEYKKKRK